MFLIASKSIFLPIESGFIFKTPIVVLGMYFGRLELRVAKKYVMAKIATNAVDTKMMIFFDFTTTNMQKKRIILENIWQVDFYHKIANFRQAG